MNRFGDCMVVDEIPVGLTGGNEQHVLRKTRPTNAVSGAEMSRFLPSLYLTSLAEQSLRVLYTAKWRGRVISHEIHQPLAGIDGSVRSIIKNVLQLFFAEVTGRIPAIAFHIHALVCREDNALCLQQLAHGSALAECPTA